MKTQVTHNHRCKMALYNYGTVNKLLRYFLHGFLSDNFTITLPRGSSRWNSDLCVTTRDQSLGSPCSVPGGSSQDEMSDYSRGSKLSTTSKRSSSFPSESLAPSSSPRTFWKLFVSVASSNNPRE